MTPLVTCLLPTFGRFPRLDYLVNEAVQCFLMQDYECKELIICNDDPQQELIFEDPQVRVINLTNRFETLGHKLRWMLQAAQGDYICRWDDDDISLPWRLSYSVNKLQQQETDRPREWRPENHWYYPGNQLHYVSHPGNTHIMSIWHRDILNGVPYPGEYCVSGIEDQTFTAALRHRGYPFLGDTVPPREVFYLYRWGTGSNHLSGTGGGEKMEANYRAIGNTPRGQGRFALTPGWLRDYIGMARNAAELLPPA